MGRSFWLANAVILLDEVLYLALIPLLPTYAARFDLSSAEAGFLYAAYPLLVLLTSIPAGLLADRVGGRHVLLAGSGLLVLATVAFALADSAWMLWGARAVQGLTAGLVATVGMASIAAGARETRRATTIGLAISVQGLSALLGYALGGFLSPVIGIKATFLAAAGVGALICIAIALDRGTPLARPATPPGLVALRSAARSSAVRASVACVLAVGLVGGSVQTLASLDLADSGYSVSGLGAVFVIAAAIGLIATPLAGRLADRYGVSPSILVWSVITAILLLLFAIPAAPPLLIAAVLAGVLPMVRVGGSLAYARGAQYARLGEGLAVGYGFVVTAWSLGAVAGPLVGGAIADASGNGLAFVAVAALVALLAWPGTRRDRPPAVAA